MGKIIQFHILLGSHICADYAPSFTVVGADMFLRNNIRNSDWSFSYSVESRIFVPIVHRLSRWSVRICFFSPLFLIKIIPFHILSGVAYLCRLLTVFHGGQCGYVSPTVRIAVPDSSDRRPRVAYLCRLFTVFHGGRCRYLSPQH